MQYTFRERVNMVLTYPPGSENNGTCGLVAKQGEKGLTCEGDYISCASGMEVAKYFFAEMSLKSDESSHDIGPRG